MAKYLITGGSGFCGLEVVKLVLSKGHQVRVIDLEPMPEHAKDVEFIKTDVRDSEAVQKSCAGMEYVIHTIAKVPITKAGKDFWRVNVEGTRNVLEGCLKYGVKKMVHISSSSVQKMVNNDPIPEDAPYHPVGLYAETKMHAEMVCKEYIQKGLKVDIIRPRTVVGVGRLGIFHILFDWIADGKKIFIMGKGDNKIQFINSEDLAACCYAGTQNSEADVYNVGGRNYGTLREDLQSLIDHAKTNSKIISLPIYPVMASLAVLDVLQLSPLTAWHYMTYFKNSYFSNQKAKEKLGWIPRYGNQDILKMSYDSFIKMRDQQPLTYGTSHRKGLKQGALSLLKKFA